MGVEKYNNWHEITCKYIVAFLRFNFLMGLNPKPSLNDYWKNDAIYYYPPVAQRTSRNRYSTAANCPDFSGTLTIFGFCPASHPTAAQTKTCPLKHHSCIIFCQTQQIVVGKRLCHFDNSWSQFPRNRYQFQRLDICHASKCL